MTIKTKDVLAMVFRRRFLQKSANFVITTTQERNV